MNNTNPHPLVSVDVDVDVDDPAWRWLRELDARCAARARAWHHQEGAVRARSGVLFRVGTHRLLATVDGLAEVLSMPHQVARVPGTAAWVIGVANHRGALLPLVDLGGLLFGRTQGGSRCSYVLVPRGGSAPYGLCVDGVIGMRRYLPQETAAPGAGLTPAPLGSGTADAWRALLAGFGQDASERLPVVDLAAVERLPAFAATGEAGVRPDARPRVVLVRAPAADGVAA